MATFGAAVLGALVGSLFGWLTSRRAAQAATAFELHRQYFSELVDSRENATRFLRLHPAGRLDELWRDLDQTEMRPIWEIVYFYERLWAAYRYRRLKRDLALDLFGASFNYWYAECFQERLVPIADPIAGHIADLHKRMRHRAIHRRRGGIAHVSDVRGWDTYQSVWQLPGEPLVQGDR
jgi:hypothetical protein